MNGGKGRWLKKIEISKTCVHDSLGEQVTMRYWVPSCMSSAPKTFPFYQYFDAI